MRATFGWTIRLAAVAAMLLLVLPTTQVQAGSLYDRLTPLQRRFLSGFASSELQPQSATSPRISSSAARGMSPTSAGSAYQPGEDGCPVRLGDNVKVNENCLNISDSDLQGRAQAQNETSIAIDPLNQRHLVASYNDYRRGDGTCGVDYSLDAGKTWQDSTTPNGFTRGTAFGGVARQYWHAGGDTSVAWDSRGNAYLDCQVFMRGPGTTNNPDTSSAIYVYRSTGNAGASWNFTGRPVVETFTSNGNVLEDKPLITVDNSKTSGFRDRIYVTWTTFAADGTGYIYESHSNDYGETFSAKVLVSADSALCTNTFGVPTPKGRCNENQFSQPFTAPDGTLYVAYSNFNNQATAGTDNRYQVLLVKSTDGGVTFGAPVKVADYYDLPDCAAYQGGADPGRSCVPEKGSMNSIFRATNYPSGAVNPARPQDVVVSIGSYINMDSKEPNCVPAGFSPYGNPLYTGVKSTPGCANNILLSVSHDGGTTFTGTTTDPRMLTDINHGGQKSADRYFQWLAYSATGRVVVSYYDRVYGDDEQNGFSDISLSASSNLTSFSTQRVTSSSNPPPTQFSGVFMGDYAGLAVGGQGNDRDNAQRASGGIVAYPFWSDTRDVDLFLCPGTGTPTTPPQVCTAPASNARVSNDQDVFTSAVNVGQRDD